MRMPIGECIQVISELIGCESVPPLLELWHLRVDSSSWLNLAYSLTSGKTAIPKMILNDVALVEDESIQGIVDSCEGVRWASFQKNKHFESSQKLLESSI